MELHGLRASKFSLDTVLQPTTRYFNDCSACYAAHIDV